MGSSFVPFFFLAALLLLPVLFFFFSISFSLFISVFNFSALASLIEKYQTIALTLSPAFALFCRFVLFSGRSQNSMKDFWSLNSSLGVFACMCAGKGERQSE